MSEAWIIDAVRTPRGKGKNSARRVRTGTHPQELMATTLRALSERNGLNAKDVDDVVVGCVSQAGEQGACIARSSVLLAEWPQEVTGVTLNRFCGSGLQGVNSVALAQGPERRRHQFLGMGFGKRPHLLLALAARCPHRVNDPCLAHRCSSSRSRRSRCHAINAAALS